jgi:hypothetical protein
MYDIVFISYDEKNAEENYSALKEKYPFSKRVNGVKGIHQAHIAAAKLSLTNMFWVVDGDAIIKDDFDFKYNPGRYNLDTVHIWYSENPVNGLSYGYGGVKLLPKRQTIQMKTDSSDMTTSISSYVKVIPQVSNITAFNTDAFSTWRSAFRECVKLSSKIIDRQDSKETEERLESWLHPLPNAFFRHEAKRGAEEGKEYGKTFKGQTEALNKINDFDWLKQKFKEA